MPTTNRVRALVTFAEQGRILDAFEEFYAADVVMQESNGAATVGRAANV